MIPCAIALSIAIPLALTVWWGFWLIGPWIGLAISGGSLLSIHLPRSRADNDLGRKLSILFIAPLFLVFLGIFQRENMQVEETVFYLAFFLSSGVFTRCLIHFAVAKVFGPLVWGRGFCGWVCWIAALVDWLPIPENKSIPKHLTWIRFPVLIVSMALPFLLIQGGYDFMTNHINGDRGFLFQTSKVHQLFFFIIGTALYYTTAVILAFVFKKKRAFCKIACPVSLIMKAQTRISLIKYIKPSGSPCSSCKACNRACLMDVDVASYISLGKAVSSSECIGCGNCVSACKANAIA
jgi:polyferredoxin